MIKRVALSLILVVIFSAHTAIAIEDTSGQIRIGAQWKKKLAPGMGQDYNFFIEPYSKPVNDAYVIIVIHPDTRVFSVQQSDGLQCSQHDDESTTIHCSASILSDRQLVTISGTILGPGNNGQYVLFRVGSMIEGSPYALALVADYYENGTIPTAIGDSDEPMQNRIYLPYLER